MLHNKIPYWKRGRHSRSECNWTPAQARYILNRDGGTCIFCGRPATEIHHVIPVRNGGKSYTSNGVCVCHACNMYEVRNPIDITYLTRAIFWLETHGEDTSWMDNVWSDENTTLTD